MLDINKMIDIQTFVFDIHMEINIAKVWIYMDSHGVYPYER